MEDNNYYIEEGLEGMMACESIPSSWGGTWTGEKLDAFEKYVNAYLTIMNVKRNEFGWKLIYFDGFAGSGSSASNNETAIKIASQIISKKQGQ
jgi:three-Cys-motif partner protein